MLDIHSHKKFGNDVIHNISPKIYYDFIQSHPQQPVSVGIHPWDILSETLEYEFELLGTIVQQNQVKAVGETGLDKNCTVPLSLQLQSLCLHIQLSERYAKPLILHCVKAYNELQKLKRQVHPRQQWIIHGFRGNPILAKQLLSDKFYFSIGWKFNAETVKILPEKFLFFETDDTDFTIDEIYNKVLSARLS